MTPLRSRTPIASCLAAPLIEFELQQTRCDRLTCNEKVTDKCVNVPYGYECKLTTRIATEADEHERRQRSKKTDVGAGIILTKCKQIITYNLTDYIRQHSILSETTTFASILSNVICRRKSVSLSSVCLSVCNVRAPYSGN